MAEPDPIDDQFILVPKDLFRLIPKGCLIRCTTDEKTITALFVKFGSNPAGNIITVTTKGLNTSGKKGSFKELQWNIQVVNIKELHKKLDPMVTVELELVKVSLVNQMEQTTKLLNHIKTLEQRITALEQRRY